MKQVLLRDLTYLEITLGIIILLVVSIGSALFIFIQTHQVLVANFADDVLRPTLGTPTTLGIEALFFKVQDSVNQLRYKFYQPPPQTISQSHVKVTPLINPDEKFLLTSIKPITNLPSLAGEGVWVDISTGTSDAIMVRTFLRPDRERPYAIVNLVKMNMSQLAIGLVSGTWEPGENFKHGTGFIPKVVTMSNMLVAAFNGGFKRTDGNYGMIVGNDTYVPMKTGLATLVVYQHTKPQIVRYTGQDLGQGIVGIRQNGPMLIEDGKDVSRDAAWNIQTWGLTTTNSMYTWRSGIGITKNGNLIYAAGPSLVPETLAQALKAAGARNAMQLDINPVWVRFVLYSSLGNGLYKYLPLDQTMVNGGYEYLHGYQKDFFYIYKHSLS